MICMLLLAILGLTNRQSDVTVDVIEFNVTEIDGSKISQIIFWKWSKARDRMEVCDYSMIDDDERAPDATIVGPYYYVTAPGHLGSVIVRARNLVHTKTDYDPERMNLKFLPYELRECPVIKAMWEKYRRRTPSDRTISRLFR